MKLTTRRYSQGARAEAAEATGRRIVDAFLTRLMAQWYDEITLDRVAEDAGVTVQTVVRRFSGKEGLLARSIKTLVSRINAMRAAPSGDLNSVVDKLLSDYEETGDAVIRLLALEPRHPALKELVDIGRREHRRWVAHALAESLGKISPASRGRALDALVIVTDVYAWKILRRDMAHSVIVTKKMIGRLIQATIAEFLTPQ
jgi:AcrR family transcriptional regulator